MTTTITKPRRLTEKQVNKILAEYDLPGRVRAHLETLGDIVWHKPDLSGWQRDYRTFGCPASGREIVVLTVFGPLGISLYGDWIACVFDDDEMGFIIVGASRPSGKWNHHAFVGYCHAPTSKEDIVSRLDETLRGFIVRLGWIVTGGTYDPSTQDPVAVLRPPT